MGGACNFTWTSPGTCPGEKPRPRGAFPYLSRWEKRPRDEVGGGGVLGLIFAGYVPLASQSPYPIVVYSVANHRPHLSHFWANM